MKLDIKDRVELSKAELEKIARLLRDVWPPKDGVFDLDADIRRMVLTEDRPIEKHIILSDGDQILAYSKLFSRQVRVGIQPVNNMALACVCVKEAFRGRGFGELIVKTAFGFVDDNTFECSIFQTQVLQFYLGLGARFLYNKFINSLSRTDNNPWWDPHVMIYPADYHLADVAIDLCGQGY